MLKGIFQAAADGDLPLLKGTRAALSSLSSSQI
jgi:hypothetical protein